MQVTAGIIRGAFETVCFEAATHLGRSASSAIINQSNERNGSVIDSHGRLAAVSVGTPQLLFHIAAVGALRVGILRRR